MTKKEGAKILPFRRNINVNIGLVIFLFIFLYLVYSLIRFAARTTYSVYQVGLPESFTSAKTYEALILRNEQPVYAEYAGYLDVFAPEGTHVSVGNTVASIDELGVYSETIRKMRDEQTLSGENLLRLKEQLKEVTTDYDGQSFGAVYEKKNAISSMFLSALNAGTLEGLEKNNTMAEFFHEQKAEISGLVTYYLDGFEGRTAASLTKADFDLQKYSRSTNTSVVTAGDFLYKLVGSEKWSLIIPLTEEEAAVYNGASALGVTFLQNGIRTSCPSTVYTGADGGMYLRLDLHQYMIRFISDRYIRITIDLGGEKGLKVPRSTVITDKFYQIPAEFVTRGGASSSLGVLREVFGENGTDSVIFTPLSMVYYDEKYYYLSTSSLDSGSVLIMPDSDERYTVRQLIDLKGVYQVNAGYTVFCPIEVIGESGDYYLLKKGSYNGVNTYDSILLNAEDYSGGQILAD